MSMDFVVRISASSILDIGAFNSLLVFLKKKLCICTPACKHKIIVQHLYIDVLHDFSIPMKLHSNLSIWAWLSCNKNTSTSDTRCQNMYLVHPYPSLWKTDHEQRDCTLFATIATSFKDIYAPFNPSWTDYIRNKHIKIITTTWGNAQEVESTTTFHTVELIGLTFRSLRPKPVVLFQAGFAWFQAWMISPWGGCWSI